MLYGGVRAAVYWQNIDFIARSACLLSHVEDMSQTSLDVSICPLQTAVHKGCTFCQAFCCEADDSIDVTMCARQLMTA